MTGLPKLVVQAEPKSRAYELQATQHFHFKEHEYVFETGCTFFGVPRLLKPAPHFRSSIVRIRSDVSITLMEHFDIKT